MQHAIIPEQKAGVLKLVCDIYGLMTQGLQEMMYL